MYASARSTYSSASPGCERTVCCNVAMSSSVVCGWAATAPPPPLGTTELRPLKAVKSATPAANTSARRRSGCGLGSVICLCPLSPLHLAPPRARRAQEAVRLWLRRSRLVPRLRPLRVRVEPGRGRRHVREARQERLVVLVDAVTERELLPALVFRQQEPADHAELDVGHIVTEPAPVREPGVVAGDHAEPAHPVGGRPPPPQGDL